MEELGHDLECLRIPVQDAQTSHEVSTHTPTDDTMGMDGPSAMDDNIEDDYDTAPEQDDDDGGDIDTLPMDSSGGIRRQSPPTFWQPRRQSRRNNNTISSSRSSSNSRRRHHIRLEDHTEAPSDADIQRGLWAKGVVIDDHAIVRGKSGGGAYTVWICKITLLEGNVVTVRMRYSEFVQLRAMLRSAFPNAYKNSIPRLPPKSSFSTLLGCIPSVDEQRRLITPDRAIQRAFLGEKTIGSGTFPAVRYAPSFLLSVAFHLPMLNLSSVAVLFRSIPSFRARRSSRIFCSHAPAEDCPCGCRQFSLDHAGRCIFYFSICVFPFASCCK